MSESASVKRLNNALGRVIISAMSALRASRNAVSGRDDRTERRMIVGLNAYCTILNPSHGDSQKRNSSS
jgi:hypothetical protein